VATIGLVAGAGKLPEIFAGLAKLRGDRVIGIGLKGVTEPGLGKHVDKLVWVDLGAVQKTVFSLVADRINRIVLLGKLKKDLFFSGDTELDADTRRMLGKLNDRKDYSLLAEASKFLGKFGIEIMDPTPYLKEFIPEKGQLTKRPLESREKEDADCAMETARQLARLDIGQTAAVKHGTVIALESVEGTDETIARAGRFSKDGFVVAKAARPMQDMRFDVPLVGLETVEALASAGGTALALESGKTFLIDRDAVVRFADDRGLAIVIM
jgi:DUF1009 family protein